MIPSWLQLMLRNFFKSSRVQTRLIALVLVASLTTILLTGLLSFVVARNLLAEAGYSRLSAMRSTQAFAVKQYLEELSDHVMTLSEARMTIEASKRFSDAYKKLPAINAKQRAEMEFYYQKEFLPRLKKIGGIEKTPEELLPRRAAESYLKYHYVAASHAVRLDVTALEDAKDGSDWSGVHLDFHKRFLRLAKLLGYQDLMLVDVATGDVVYSAFKQDDLGSNLLAGPYANTPAATVFREVRKSKDPFFITFSDFARYEPDYGKPTMFVGTTVFEGDKFIGALLVQISNERIDALMTDHRNWKAVGMGKTGETYLVGEDGTFRSSPRFFLESPRKYLEAARRQGLPPATLEAIQKTGTPVLLQSVNTPGARNALDGKKGISVFKDYRGVPVVSAYQPIRFGPYEWGLLAELDQAELFSGIGHLARSQLLLAALLIPAMAFLTIKMEQAFTRPIRRLVAATDKIRSGDYNIKIPVAAEDEFGELATAFNSMSAKLADREDRLKQQVDENQRLLLSIFPGSTASRLSQGGAAMAETHANVSVVFAEIEGWNEFAQSLAVDDSIALFNQLVSSIEVAGHRIGVEKMQQVGTRYLAVSGLVRPRSGHEQRAVHFGLEMLALIRSFNRLHDSNLSLAIAVHAGPLSTGVLRGQRLSFDIWGDTVNVARILHEYPHYDVLYASAAIVASLRGSFAVRPLAPLSVKGHEDLPIWAIDGPIPSPLGQPADFRNRA